MRRMKAKRPPRRRSPPISGEDIMETFKIPAGREVGIIKNQIREAILEGEINNSREEALNFMIKKAKDLGLEPFINFKQP